MRQQDPTEPESLWKHLRGQATLGLAAGAVCLKIGVPPEHALGLGLAWALLVAIAAVLLNYA